MPFIIIAPLKLAAEVVAGRADAWACGLLGPEMAHAHPELPNMPQSQRLRLSLHDVDGTRPGFQAAAPQQMADMISFARRWWRVAQAGRAGPLLVHCWFGISRSPAAAYVMQCALRPAADEMAIARELRSLAPWATPNAHLVALADSLLGRNGRMQRAIAALGRGREASSGEVVHWPVAGGKA